MAKNDTIYCPVSPQEESISFQMHDFQANSSRSSPVTSSQSHRQAEKRRRDRINGQLARLRKLVPMSDKMDKAALLERVVDQIKELKRETSEISKFLTIPTDTDDVTIEFHANIDQGIAIPPDKDTKNAVLIKATFCCEDRPDLIPDLVRALKSLKFTTIGADFASLGGRIKTVLLLYYKDDDEGNCDSKEGGFDVSTLKQSLMSALTRLVSWSAAASNFRVTSKRQRFFFAS
ncbi:hypothetical protein RND81_03G165200 [Saponaria officinalis]|uniref:BHLH domain-containing protein n=1 Tax=Saponaria officinalis TaxID=3572 RepID=A0AAW1M0X3_SAPOF